MTSTSLGARVSNCRSDESTSSGPRFPCMFSHEPPSEVIYFTLGYILNLAVSWSSVDLGIPFSPFFFCLEACPSGRPTPAGLSQESPSVSFLSPPLVGDGEETRSVPLVMLGDF